MKKFGVLTAIVLLSVMLLSGCGDRMVEWSESMSEKMTNTGENIGEAIRDKGVEIAEKVDSIAINEHVVNILDNPYVLLVKGGSLEAFPENTLDEAFSQFFGNPKWGYFWAESGEHVVEFSGLMMYADVEVEANLQFIVIDDSDRFEVGALSFNDVPQNELIKRNLLTTVFEGGILDTIPNTEIPDLSTSDEGEPEDLPIDDTIPFVFAAEDRLAELNNDQLDYFQLAFPHCFESYFDDYDTETCLYWETNPENHEEYSEFWENAWELLDDSE